MRVEVRVSSLWRDVRSAEGRLCFYSIVTAFCWRPSAAPAAAAWVGLRRPWRRRCLSRPEIVCGDNLTSSWLARHVFTTPLTASQLSLYVAAACSVKITRQVLLLRRYSLHAAVMLFTNKKSRRVRKKWPPSALSAYAVGVLKRCRVRLPVRPSVCLSRGQRGRQQHSRIATGDAHGRLGCIWRLLGGPTHLFFFLSFEKNHALFERA